MNSSLKQNRPFLYYIKYLGWITQLGVSLVCPPVLFSWIAWKIQQRFALGTWIMVVGIVFGVLTAICTFISFAKGVLNDLNNNEEEEHET